MQVHHEFGAVKEVGNIAGAHIAMRRREVLEVMRLPSRERESRSGMRRIGDTVAFYDAYTHEILIFCLPCFLV
jgi:hypothetical protein